ncbi:CBP80/20-dependent translation initiation factor [Galemys pyrenaicus]|uniref:CBP80/20-dependent translation initiation factor n=1 Tax=Galemys pyrenaicus TaxID=202257 RepID=A0A8J5ZCW7_GALPY|nr:CBP80/20-dependent translation initiation factor [Galemys pyrenaicus]
MENSSAASASSEAGSSRSQEIEELERFIDSYVLEYQVQGLLADKTEGDGESEKTQSHISHWTANCSVQLDSSFSFSQGRAPPQQNGSKDSSLDMLGTDIWAANTFDSFSGATWDLQPEKLDFTQFHRKLRHVPKQSLPHIDREGCGKGKLEDGDGINLNDIEKVLPTWQCSASGTPITGAVGHRFLELPMNLGKQRRSWCCRASLVGALNVEEPDPASHGWCVLSRCLARETGHRRAAPEQAVSTSIMHTAPEAACRGYHPLPHEVEIAHTKKLFRRRRNDRRDQLECVLSPGLQEAPKLAVRVCISPPQPGRRPGSAVTGGMHISSCTCHRAQRLEELS